MPKATRIQAIDTEGRIVHEFASIAAAGAAGFSHGTINRQLHHNGKPVDGLRWVRKAGPVASVPSIDRLAILVERLEIVAEQLYTVASRP